MDNFVYIDEYGLLGSNFYWHKAEAYDISKEELTKVGLKDDRVQVHQDIISLLLEVDSQFQKKLGYRLYIKEGYRSSALYRLVYDKRVARFGQEQTDKLLNIKDMYHTTGKAVDVALWDMEKNKEVFMRDGKDDPEALIFGFYKNKTDDRSLYYQGLQEQVVEIMKDHGFEMGKLGEYFHFNHKSII